MVTKLSDKSEEVFEQLEAIIGQDGTHLFELPSGKRVEVRTKDASKRIIEVRGCGSEVLDDTHCSHGYIYKKPTKSGFYHYYYLDDQYPVKVEVIDEDGKLKVVFEGGNEMWLEDVKDHIQWKKRED